jgi:hypothetical protein
MRASVCCAIAIPIAIAACGGKKNMTSPDGGGPMASASASAMPASVAPAESKSDSARDRAIVRACTNKCERECEAKDHNRIDFFDEKRAEIPKAPFDVKVERVWLRGSCHKGDTPEKRDDGDGLTATVEGKMTYKGDDPIFWADLEGWFYVDTGDGHTAAVSHLDKTYSAWSGSKPATRMVRRVRGADPWRKSQERDFHWESRALNEAFCELRPKGAFVMMQLRTMGLKSEIVDTPIANVPIVWDEIAGVALKEHVTIKRGENAVDEAADASFARLDKLLITTAAGKAEWLARTAIVQGGLFQRGAAPTLPAQVESPSWSVKVTSVTGGKQSGEYVPTGEDQFVVEVNVEIESKASEGKPVKVKSFGFQLESTPGSWQSPLAKAPGQIDGTAEIAPGEKASGKLVFARQRFERPFRLQVKTPDRATLLADVFTYDLGPEGWK